MNEIRFPSSPVMGPAAASAGQKATSPGGPFGELLSQSIAAVNSQMGEADALARGLASGQHANIHETMIAAEKAGISFRLMTRVQQKALDAYQEIMRMQL